MDDLSGVPSAVERSRAKLLPRRTYETSGLSMLIASVGGAFAELSSAADFCGEKGKNHAFIAEREERVSTGWSIWSRTTFG